MIWYRQEGNNGDGGQRELRIIKTSASAQSMRNIAKQNAVVWLKLQCHLVCHIITKQQRKEECLSTWYLSFLEVLKPQAQHEYT